MLCALLAFSTILVSAAEDENIGSGGTVSKKEKIIDCLISDESWFKNAEGVELYIQFVDLDFDGNLEFLTEAVSQNGYVNTHVYNIGMDDYDGLAKTDGSFDSTISPKNLIGYYDTKSKKYRTIGSTDTRGIKEQSVNAYHYDYEVLNDSKDSRRFVNKSIAYYQISNGHLDPNGEKIYFDGNGNVVTESDYNSIIENYLSGLVNVNMKFETYSFPVLPNNEYSVMTEDKKREKLGELYDSFIYDPYEKDRDNQEPDNNENSDSDSSSKLEHDIQEYEADDLINKTIPEIIEIMGGEYDCAGGDRAEDLTGIDDSKSILTFRNEEKIPGMKFCWIGMVTNGFDSYIRSSLEKGEYSLYAIQVTGQAKADEKISADMNYDDCSKALGKFDCELSYMKTFNGREKTISYTYESQNADVILNFEIDSSLQKKIDDGQTKFTSDEMHNSNPKLRNVEVLKGDVTTETDSENDDTSHYDSESDSLPDPTPIPVVKEYTATELINKTIPEIIEIMGGEYDCGADRAKDPTGIDDANSIFSIYNQEKIPGMKFCWVGMITNGFDSYIRSSLEKGEYPLYAIQVTGSAKADEKINADMNYNDCSKAIGKFDCELSYMKTYNGREKTISYSYESQNAIVILNFEIDSSLQKKIDAGQTEFTSDEMRENNSKLRNIEVFKNSNSTDTDSAVDSESSGNGSANNGNSNSNSNSSGNNSSANTSSSVSPVSTGVITTGVSTIALILVVSGAAVIVSRKRRKD